MKIEVLIFGAAARGANSDRVAVELGNRPNVSDVLTALYEQHPTLRFALPAPNSGRLAVNHSFVNSDHEINFGDEVALVTLVGGG